MSRCFIFKPLKGGTTNLLRFEHRLAVNLYCVDEADDRAVDRQRFGFRCESSTRTLHAQHDLPLAAAERTVINVRPVGLRLLASFSSTRNGSTISSFWPIIDSTFCDETKLPVMRPMNMKNTLER